jgi:hypothetical protein
MKLLMRERRVRRKIMIRDGTIPGPLKVAGIPRIQEPRQLLRRRTTVVGIPFAGRGRPSAPKSEDMLLRVVSDIVTASEVNLKEPEGGPLGASLIMGGSSR